MIATDVIPVMRPTLGQAEADAAAAAVASGWVAQGPRVAAFEQALADRVGASHGVAVSSCTTALHLALVLLDLDPASEVVVPSLSFIATANVAGYVGATPVFADVEANTLNMTVETIERVLTERTRAVVLVHQAGVPADIDGIGALCADHGVALVEDAACAIGSSYRNRSIGAHSPMVAFSFHPRKVITTGEGGMLLLRDGDAAVRARRLREHGMSVSAAERHAAGGFVVEEYVERGFNMRMTDIQAAVGMVQLGRLTEIVERRRALAQRYHALLNGVPGLTMIADPPHGLTNYQSFWVTLPESCADRRNGILATMAERGVQGRRGIMASHLEPAYAGEPCAPLPVTDRAARASLILPLYHDMTERDQDRVIDVFLDAAGLSAQ